MISRPKVPFARTAGTNNFVDLKFFEELDRSGYLDGLYR